MKVSKLTNQLDSSETNGEHLVNAMRLVNSSSQEVETVKNRVAQIERQIKDAGIGRFALVLFHTYVISGVLGGTRRNLELAWQVAQRSALSELDDLAILTVYVSGSKCIKSTYLTVC